MEAFFLAFIPLFVAVDAFGVLPMFLSLTAGTDRREHRRVVLQSVLTASVVGLLFLFGGRTLLRLLGITMADFMIAGGLLLFAISLSDMLTLEKRQRHVDAESLGAVPIGIPLIVGPAVLTTGILLLDQFGFALTTAALLSNVVLAGVVFWFAHVLTRLLGRTGAKVISKLASLLLTAFAVMMIRKGILLTISGT
jgi:multiple antibiotic resistance protein